MTAPAPPIACELTSAARAARVRDITEELLAHVEQQRELPRGYALRFAWSEARLQSLTDFIIFESECCPFLEMELRLEPGRQHLWLRLCGPTGTKAFLANELVVADMPHTTTVDSTAHRGSGLMRLGGLLSATGVVGLACCVLPALGIAGMGVAASFVDLGSAVILTVGAVLLTAGLVTRWRNSKQSCGCPNAPKTPA